MPKDYKIEKAKEQIKNEISSSKNIKSKETRERVLSALNKIQAELDNYKKLENGLAIFAAEDFIRSIEPKRPLNIKKYSCGKEFDIFDLEESQKDKTKYGLILIEDGGISIGFLLGKTVIEVYSKESRVPRKMSRGGQSSVRFARLREEARHIFFKRCGEKVIEIFNGENLSGILIGGGGYTKEEFLEKYMSNEYKEKVISIEGTTYLEKQGLEELVNRSIDKLVSEGLKEEKEEVNTMMYKVAHCGESVTYGTNRVKEEIENRNVWKMVMSKELEGEYVNIKGIEIIVVSGETEEGKLFNKNFKVAAYKKNWQ